MKLLAFYIGLHDSNMSIYDGCVRYFKSERITQEKHHCANLAWVRETCESLNFTPDAIAFSDGNRNRLGKTEKDSLWKFAKGVTWMGKSVPTYCIDHHYAHILSAWPVREKKHIDFGVAIDGRGDHNRKISILKNPFEISPEVIFHSENHAYADFFNAIGRRMKLAGESLDFGGKVMGAHAYGKVDYDFVEQCRKPEFFENPLFLITTAKWRGNIPERQQSFFSFESECFRDWLASIHFLIGEFILKMFFDFIPQEASVVYSGGAAQNTVYNNTIFSHYPNTIIPPHCYDGGLSLGCLEFLRINYGINEFGNHGFPFWQCDSDVGYADVSTIREIVRCIKNGKIVGWVQGRGEIGPRALGHRSILFNPMIQSGKDHLNSTVKKRESWRPYAPSVLASRSEFLLDSPATSPYMLRALKVNESAKLATPAVVHVDNTSRIQTVDPSVPELHTFHTLLTFFEEETNCPAVLNTSFNTAGGPIISTAAQAIEMWQNSELDVVCIGNKIMSK